ncbi:MAG: HlyD family type I secretion periplasmic adaptor subunit [Herminiimonas sp.]|nr:HlyD family type I secretion periplasmic adaptor subunit [Herminiimonas sp.]
MKLLKQKDPATDVVSHDVALSEVNTDASSHTRLGWWIVLAGVGGFILWATLAPLDKGVPVQGTVAVATNRKAIQHLGGGTVEDILVKDGDVVKAGQVLVKMNDVQVKSAAEISRIQYFVSRAAEARLLAERDGLQTIAFPKDLESVRSDPRVAENINMQRQLFTSRQSALKSELAGVDENIAGLKAQIQGLKDSGESQKQQQKILKDQLVDLRDLAKDGYIARNRVLDLERTYAQVNGTISENIGNIGRAQRQISELSLRRLQRQQEFQKEVRSQLTDVQKEGDALSHRLESQDFDLANVQVRAPVGGTVVGMNIFTRGGVISPGFRMMDIVPSDDKLIVEGQVPVNLIDKVVNKLPVELIFSAFNQNQTPHVPGIVTQVSADRLTDEKTGQPYYKMRAEPTAAGLKILANLPVRAGMPVEIFVKTGERTMMSYLLKPVFDRAKTSMTEE